MEESSDLVNMIIGQLKSGCLISAKGTKVRHIEVCQLPALPAFFF
jgi:hypothetical protein